MYYLQLVEIGFILFVMHAIITVPAALVAGYVGWRAPRCSDVFTLFGLGLLLVAGMPMVAGAAKGAATMAYMSLP